MAITIRRLNCHVHVVAGTESPILHQGEQADRPSMEFAMTMGAATAEREETGPVEGASVSGSREPEKRSMSPGEVDAHKVTDRVYELMKQEIISGQSRGGLKSNHAKR